MGDTTEVNVGAVQTFFGTLSEAQLGSDPLFKFFKRSAFCSFAGPGQGHLLKLSSLVEYCSFYHQEIRV